MNKALEKKLIRPLEESHTKEQSHKAALWMELWASRSKMAARWARTWVWAGWWFFWEEEGVCGGWNKWRGATRGPRGRGARPGGVGASWTLVARCLLPLMCSQCQIFSIILETIILNFQGIWSTFIFGVFFNAWIIQKTDRKILFLLYSIWITKSKKRVQRVVFSKFIHLMLIKRNPLIRLIKSC